MNRALAASAVALIASCMPLERDYKALPSGEGGELAVVQTIAPIRVETIDSTTAGRLIPVFLLAGPLGLAAASTAEGDYSTVNGREYTMRRPNGEVFALRGFAVVQPGDCVLLRRDGAGRYLAPMRRPTADCADAVKK